jgi:hypothetical protein
MSDTPDVHLARGFQHEARASRCLRSAKCDAHRGRERLHPATASTSRSNRPGCAILDAAQTGTKDKLAYTLDNVAASYPPNRYATMITSHDQNRVANELREDLSMKHAASLLTAPGAAVLHGEEIARSCPSPSR